MGMNREQITAKVLSAFEEMGIRISNAKPISEQFDSIQLVVLVTALEEKFKISVGALDVNETNFSSLESVAKYVEEKIGR